MALSRDRDEIERLFSHLVRVLASRSPGLLDQPIGVEDLYQRLIPYRGHRSSLQFDTNQDYEMALLRLLAGERGLAAIEQDDVRSALHREARSSNPDPGAFRAFPAATFRLDPLAVRATLEAEQAYAPPAEGPSPPRDVAPEPEAACPHCDRTLPAARAVTFCPHCGGNVTQPQCPSCGTQLEPGWKFCITCGVKRG